MRDFLDNYLIPVALAVLVAIGLSIMCSGPDPGPSKAELQADSLAATRAAAEAYQRGADSAAAAVQAVVDSLQARSRGSEGAANRARRGADSAVASLPGDSTASDTIQTLQAALRLRTDEADSLRFALELEQEASRQAAERARLFQSARDSLQRRNRVLEDETVPGLRERIGELQKARRWATVEKVAWGVGGYLLGRATS